MRVRATCNLKNSSMKDKFPGGLISEGTIFEGSKNSIPDFVHGELERKSGTFEILPELKPEEKKKKKVEFVAPANKLLNGPRKKKSSSLREKLTKAEK